MAALPIPTVEQVLNRARGELGYREGPNNATKYGEWYGMPNVSWCDQFVSWVAAVTGAEKIIGRSAYTPSHALWFKSIGRWGNTPRPGALVFYDFPDSVHRIQHVGIVESVRDDGRIQVIEGNTSSGVGGSQADGGGVHRRVRATTYVVGYGYPAYAERQTIVVDKLPNPAKGRPAVLLVDGVWGTKTTKALQAALNIPADGEIGPQTRKALQRRVGATPDGVWGKQTRKATQRYLRVPMDGEWGPITIKALQRRLNRGTF